MLGFFKKKPTVAESAIREIYGDNPPVKSADLERAITLAYEDLLFEQIPLRDVQRLTTGLFNGPMPFSTHDLAVSTALAFFGTADNIERLAGCQLAARVRVLNWLKESEVALLIAIEFENTLYREYKASASASPLIDPAAQE